MVKSVIAKVGAPHEGSVRDLGYSRVEGDSLKYAVLITHPRYEPHKSCFGNSFSQLFWCWTFTTTWIIYKPNTTSLDFLPNYFYFSVYCLKIAADLLTQGISWKLRTRMSSISFKPQRAIICKSKELLPSVCRWSIKHFFRNGFKFFCLGIHAN